MSQTSPQGKVLTFPTRRQLRARAGTHIGSDPELREAPPTAPLPFPITRLPQPPIVPEPVRLPSGLPAHLVNHAACLDLLFQASPEAAEMLLPVIQAVTAAYPKTAIRS